MFSIILTNFSPILYLFLAHSIDKSPHGVPRRCTCNKNWIINLFFYQGLQRNFFISCFFINILKLGRWWINYIFYTAFQIFTQVRKFSSLANARSRKLNSLFPKQKSPCQWFIISLDYLIDINNEKVYYNAVQHTIEVAKDRSSPCFSYT